MAPGAGSRLVMGPSGGGGSGGFSVDPTAVMTAATLLDSLRMDLQTIQQKAHGADPGWSTLGLLGEIISPMYRGLLDEVHQHLDLMDEGLRTHVTNLQTAASTYDEVEQGHLKDLREALDRLTESAAATSSGWSLSAGGRPLLGFNPATDVPFVSTFATGCWTTLVDIAHGESGATIALDDLQAGADGLLPIVAAIADPLNYLITCGLAFLINLVKPLKQILDLVTGDPDALQEDIDTWTGIAQALDALAVTAGTGAAQHLIGWEGGAADAAAASLGRFVQGIKDTATEIGNLTAQLGTIKALMLGAQAAIESLLATFIEWLVFTWLAALAAEVPTAGASTAVAATASEGEAVVATSRGVQILDRVVTMLGKVAKALEKIGADMKGVQEGFKVGSSAARASKVAPGFKSLTYVLTRGQLDPNAANIGVWGQIIADTGVGVGRARQGSGSAPSDGTIDKELRGTA